MKTKIAIACQGGGSQTAFTAGVLKGLFEEGVHQDFDIVSFSRTSGGSICAALAWYSLKKKDREPWRRIIDFWDENTAQTPQELAFNKLVVESLRAVSRGQAPQYNVSPAEPMMAAIFGATTSAFRPHFTDLRALLEAHIDFDEWQRWGALDKGPALLIGAADVLSGQLVKFSSRAMAIRAEHILASCAVPNIFPAVEFDGRAYWDGLFSDNPPVKELIRAIHVGAENMPQELWVIKINPTTCAKAPVLPEAIGDRRNQLVGNVSLFQSLDTVAFVNDLLGMGAFHPDFLKKFDVTGPVRIPRSYPGAEDRDYYIPFIEISEELQVKLDYQSKLDRSPENIGALMADGEKQARVFLKNRA
ncbi:patatin-like phospholipase family protein [Uliginosibacterium sp. H3]|uniref:Patatin-like phospholipase family protein n=1 Tax=Uliginosibacterium silvisoli TaxID=3114758 RepID=A0ABU6K6L9_9RHOO|nr:patatin-like phospholipase family protein [Uliginosibacterium sp. H3]